MSAIKEYHHNLIEKKSRLYSVIELQNMEKARLIEIAERKNITVAPAKSKEFLICKILYNQ